MQKWGAHVSLSLSFLGIVIAFIVLLVIIAIIVAAAIIVLAKANKEKPPSYKVKTQKEDDKEWVAQSLRHSFIPPSLSLLPPSISLPHSIILTKITNI